MPETSSVQNKIFEDENEPSGVFSKESGEDPLAEVIKKKMNNENLQGSNLFKEERGESVEEESEFNENLYMRALLRDEENKFLNGKNLFFSKSRYFKLAQTKKSLKSRELLFISQFCKTVQAREILILNEEKWIGESCPISHDSSGKAYYDRKTVRRLLDKGKTYLYFNAELKDDEQWGVFYHYADGAVTYSHVLMTKSGHYTQVRMREQKGVPLKSIRIVEFKSQKQYEYFLKTWPSLDKEKETSVDEKDKKSREKLTIPSLSKKERKALKKWKKEKARKERTKKESREEVEEFEENPGRRLEKKKEKAVESRPELPKVQSENQNGEQTDYNFELKNICQLQKEGDLQVLDRQAKGLTCENYKKGIPTDFQGALYLKNVGAGNYTAYLTVGGKEIKTEVFTHKTGMVFNWSHKVRVLGYGGVVTRLVLVRESQHKLNEKLKELESFRDRMVQAGSEVESVKTEKVTTAQEFLQKFYAYQGTGEYKIQVAKTLTMGPGVPIQVSNRKFEKPLIIEGVCEDKEKPQTCTGINYIAMKNVNNIQFKNLKVMRTHPKIHERFRRSVENSWRIYESHNLVFHNVYVTGSDDGLSGLMKGSLDGILNDPEGILFQDCSNVLIYKSVFENLFHGVSFLRLENFVAFGNVFNKITSDAFTGGALKHGLIESNISLTKFPVKAKVGSANIDVHSDFVQLFTNAKNKVGPSFNVTIRHNRIRKGEVYSKKIHPSVVGWQCYFTRDETGDLNPTQRIPHEFIFVYENLCFSNQHHGVTINGVRNAYVANNAILEIPNTGLSVTAMIRIQNSSQVSVHSNIYKTLEHNLNEDESVGYFANFRGSQLSTTMDKEVLSVLSGESSVKAKNGKQKKSLLKVGDLFLGPIL